MPLLNYTTTVPAIRTIGQVQEILVKAGARQVLTEYGPGGTPTGVAFAIETQHGTRQYRLPVDVAAVQQTMRNDRTVPPRYRNPDQAERVGWRILKDWIEAQLAIIETQMVAFEQVMLPYMATGTNGQTVYDLWLDQQLALMPGDDAIDGEEVPDA